MARMLPFWSSSPFRARLQWQKSPGSLTARLKACGSFSVQVLHAGLVPAAAGECAALGLQRAAMVYARTVCLRVNGRPVVVARSIAACRAMHGPWRGLRRQGTRPLGEMLWCNPAVDRGGLQFARVSRRHGVHRMLRRQWPALPATINVRRACFYLQGQPLLVLEAFLPEIEELPCC